MDEIRLRPKDVLGALQIGEDHLRGWNRHNMVPNLDAQREWKGTVNEGRRQRRYTEGDFYALALVAAAAKHGLPCRLIGKFARTAAEDGMAAGEWRNLYLKFTEWFTKDRSMQISYSPPAEGESDFVLMVNTGAIIREAQENLWLLEASKALRAKYLSAEETADN